MSDPVATAKHVLETKNVSGIPVLALGAIADSECIPYRFNEYPDTWDGTLLFKGRKRAILINTRINRTERHHFTLAHELGHYFLKHPPTYHSNGESGIRCSTGNIENESKPREVQANQFAVELLMPEAQFRPSMAGAPIDFTLIGNLAKQFMVSKQACSYRIMVLTQSPGIIIRSKDGRMGQRFRVQLEATYNGLAAFREIQPPTQPYNKNGDTSILKNAMRANGLQEPSRETN